MDIEQDVLNFGNMFRGRIDDLKLNAALEYVGFNECALAFETVCDYICEENVAIGQTEYQKILDLGSLLKIEWHHGQLKCLRALLSPN